MPWKSSKWSSLAIPVCFLLVGDIIQWIVSPTSTHLWLCVSCFETELVVECFQETVIRGSERQLTHRWYHVLIYTLPVPLFSTNEILQLE